MKLHLSTIEENIRFKTTALPRDTDLRSGGLGESPNMVAYNFEYATAREAKCFCQVDIRQQETCQVHAVSYLPSTCSIVYD
jgi:hypothetical protein